MGSFQHIFAYASKHVVTNASTSIARIIFRRNKNVSSILMLIQAPIGCILANLILNKQVLHSKDIDIPCRQLRLYPGEETILHLIYLYEWFRKIDKVHSEKYADD